MGGGGIPCRLGSLLVLDRPCVPGFLMDGVLPMTAKLRLCLGDLCVREFSAASSVVSDLQFYWYRILGPGLFSAPFPG